MGSRGVSRQSFAGALNEGRLDALVGDEVRAYKVVLLGHTAVGKSSIIGRFVRGEFSEETETTIGAAFFAKQITVGGVPVKFDIWDTAGQERYTSLAPMYYRGAAAAIVVYDQSAPDSFERAKFWIEQVKQCGNQNTVILLAANKYDLPRRAVPVADAKNVATSNQCLFIETSARTGHNIALLFTQLAQKLLENPSNQNDQKNTTNALRITAQPPTPPKGMCGC